jgi:hypothetical protein
MRTSSVRAPISSGSNAGTAIPCPTTGRWEPFFATADGLEKAAAAPDGAEAFHRYCGACHRPEPQNAAIALIGGLDHDAAIEALGDLPGIFVLMPNLQLSAGEREALYGWIRARSTESRTERASLGD